MRAGAGYTAAVRVCGCSEGMVRGFIAYLVAVVVAYVGAAVAHTQSVLWRLGDLGVPVTFADRVEATVHDLFGMAGTLLPLIALAMAIALPVATLAIRVLPSWRPVGYTLAGGVALLVLHIALELTLGVTPVAGARGTLGLTIQALCGGFGGWLFLQCLPARRRG